ncbi:MAG TPA: D-hexose-6-phosphate mutarotase [Tepidisphaeraceae bacterium]|nr:D-hexose-6-phosphate mutarotase [Tepidisphaeraceae bacterium]
MPNEPFEIPGVVRINAGQGGLKRIVVSLPQADAEIYLHGAHVTRFDLAGQAPALFMSKSSMFEAGKPIRGGVPICFPWFGPKKDDSKAPAHGFARLREWKIESITQPEKDRVVITLMLESDAATRAMWPADFVMRHIITVGAELQMKLQVTNKSKDPIRFEQALHTYLSIGDIKQTTVEGLANVKYIDKVDGARTKSQTDPLIKFTGETDRVYTNTQSMCIVHDDVQRRTIDISKSGSDDTVVWNPWINKAKAMPDFGDEEWPGMVCVETANVGEESIGLRPGQTHTMTATVRTWPSK